MERMIVDVYSRSYQDTVVGRYNITSCVYLLLTVDEPSKGEQPIGRRKERSLLQQAYVCNSKGHDTRLDTNVSATMMLWMDGYADHARLI